MKLSVVIPSRNRASNLLSTLDALDNQTLNRSEYEIILVDDNSDDATQSYINRYRNKPFKYIFSSVPKPHTWNASIPRNLGVLVSDPSTTHVLFVDSDVVLPSNALECYIEDINNNPNRVVIGSYEFYQQGNEQVASEDVRRAKFDEVSVNDTFDTFHDGLACFGGNLLIPKDIFWSVKGFSVDTHIGLEDGDMGLKLWKKQTKFSYDRRTKGKHLWHESPADRFPPNMREHIDKLNMKHFGMPTSEVDQKIDLITASRETYASWGITGWNPPPEWGLDK